MSDSQPIESLRVRGSVYPEPATHDELLSALEAAKSGNEPETARELMAEMLRQLRAGSRTIYPYVENWVIYAFARILEEGWKADQAFGLLARHGKRKRANTHDRDIIATAMVILAMRSKNTWECAIDVAANKLFDDGSGEAAVKVAYAKYKESVDPLSDDELAELIASSLRS